MSKISTHLTLALILFLFGSACGFFFLKVIDPDTASAYRLAILYAIIFILIYSGAVLLGYFMRIIFFRNGVHFDFLRSSERQGILLGLLGVSSLILSSYSFLNLWSIIPLIFVFFMFELYS